VPRFYFHLYDDLIVRDEEGRMLPDVKAAQAVALHCVRELASEQVLGGRLYLRHRIKIEDELGANVGTVHFRDAVEVIS
jgi:hypothetical protein